MFIDFMAIVIKCDCCGKYFDDDIGVEHWFRSKQEATEAVIDDGWAEIDGKIYCPSCYTYNEDTDEYEVIERRHRNA